MFEIKGFVYYGSFDKDLVVWLCVLIDVGWLFILFIIGLLVGIGEMLFECVDMLYVICKLYKEFGYI